MLSAGEAKIPCNTRVLFSTDVNFDGLKDEVHVTQCPNKPEQYSLNLHLKERALPIPVKANQRHPVKDGIVEFAISSNDLYLAKDFVTFSNKKAGNQFRLFETVILPDNSVNSINGFSLKVDIASQQVISAVALFKGHTPVNLAELQKQPEKAD